MTEEELKVQLIKTFDNYLVAYEVDGRYSPEGFVISVLDLLKQAGYVQLDEKQDLPPTPVPISTVEPISLSQWYKTAQQDMLKAGFKKVK